MVNVQLLAAGPVVPQRFRFPRLDLSDLARIYILSA